MSTPGTETPEKRDQGIADDRVPFDPSTSKNVEKVTASSEARSKLLSFGAWAAKKLACLAFYVACYVLVGNVVAYRLFPMLQYELNKFPHYHGISSDEMFTRYWEWVAFYHAIQSIDKFVVGGRVQKFVMDSIGKIRAPSPQSQKKSQ